MRLTLQQNKVVVIAFLIFAMAYASNSYATPACSGPSDNCSGNACGLKVKSADGTKIYHIATEPIAANYPTSLQYRDFSNTVQYCKASTGSNQTTVHYRTGNNVDETLEACCEETISCTCTGAAAECGYDTCGVRRCSVTCGTNAGEDSCYSCNLDGQCVSPCPGSCSGSGICS